MYYIYETSGPSLLIESVDSMIYIPYPRERAPTTECPPTPLFWLKFLLWSKVYALYIVHNLLHYNNDAAASYLVWNYVNMPVGCG